MWCNLEDNISYFKKINLSIHPLAEEVTILSGFVDENLFDIKSVPQEFLVRFIDEIGHRFGLAVDLKNLQQLSFQAADGVRYHEDKLMAVYSGGKNRHRELATPALRPHDDYCVNYFLRSLQVQEKYYDLEIDFYEKPIMPEGSFVASPFGLGLTVDQSRYDYYFCHPNMAMVADFFSLPAPTLPQLTAIDSDNQVLKVFGLSYDPKTLRPIKLKRYFYPQDPKLTYILFDEVGGHV